MRWLLPFLLFALPAFAADPLESAIDAVAAERGAEKDAAVIVAIEDYAYVGDVEGARKNARLWRQWFNRRGTKNVRVIKNAAAKHAWTKTGDPKGILNEVDAAAKQVKKGGTLWFVFIGHGAPLTSGNQAEGALLAQDVEQTADSIEARGIGIESDLLPRLAKAPNSVAILDACFSGKNQSGAPVVPGLQPLVPVTQKAPGKVTVFTAARDTEFAGPLPKQKRPAFSYLMLGALAGWADGEIDRRKDKKISAAEAHAYVETQLGNLIRGRSQTPTLRGPDRKLTQAWAAAANLGGDTPQVQRTPDPAKPAPVNRSVSWSKGRVSTTEKRGGRRGLTIHQEVHIQGMKGQRTELSCYLYQSRGGMLPSPDKTYAAPNKQVAVTQYDTPSSVSRRKSFSLFIPEKELHLDKGRHDLKLRCEAFDGGKPIGKSSFTWFTYTMGGKSIPKKVTFSGGRMTHNHWKKGQKGLRLHHKVQAKGMKSRELEVSCYFHYDKAGSHPLKDYNKRFNTPSGKVSVSERVTVLYDDSNFADFKHFIPYDEFHLGPGKTKLKVRCQAFDSGKLLGSSGWQKLTYTGAKKKNNTQKAFQKKRNTARSNAKAYFSNPKLVHNQFKNGKKGLGLRHKLKVQNMQNKRLEVTCYFYFKKSGKILKDYNGKYKTTGGDVSVADYVTVKYKDASWASFKHFIPYDELHLGKGKHELKTRCEAFDQGRSIGIGPWSYLTFRK